MYILLLHEGYSINYLGVSVSCLCYIIITYNIMHHVDKTVIKHIRVYHASVLFRTFYDVKSRPTQKVFKIFLYEYLNHFLKVIIIIYFLIPKISVKIPPLPQRTSFCIKLTPC